MADVLAAATFSDVDDRVRFAQFFNLAQIPPSLRLLDRLAGDSNSAKHTIIYFLSSSSVNMNMTV